MARASQLGYIHRIEPNHFRADEPVDTSRVWFMFDGLSHLVDESGGYKINWVRPFGQFGEDSDLWFNASPWLMYFPATVPHPNQYMNYEVRVATSSFDDGLGGLYAIRASIVTVNGPKAVTGLAQGVLGTAIVYSPGTTGWNLEARFTNIDADRCPLEFWTINNAAGHAALYGKVPMLCCVIEYPMLDATGLGTAWQILGVQVREYPR